MNLKTLIAGLIGAAAISTTAMAADPNIIAPPAPPPPIAVAPAGFDWSGLYVGANIAGSFLISPPVPLQIVGYGGQAGFNIVRGSFLFGPQVTLFKLLGQPGSALLLGGRVGLLVGQEDRLLLYAAASYAVPLNIANGVAQPFFGGGAEFRVGRRLSLFAELSASVAPAIGVSCCTVFAGVNFHFGN